MSNSSAAPSAEEVTALCKLLERAVKNAPILPYASLDKSYLANAASMLERQQREIERLNQAWDKFDALTKDRLKR